MADISDDAVLQAAATLVAAKITAAATRKEAALTQEALADELASAFRSVRAGMKILKQSKAATNKANAATEPESETAEG
jgi:hypothetical protein